MNKLASIIIKGRYILLAAAIGLCVLSVFLLPKVMVNYDLSEYLSSKTETKKALTAMQGEFDNVSSLKALIEGKDDDQIASIISRIRAVDGVLTLSSEEKDGDTLLSITLDGSGYSEKVENSVKEIALIASDEDIILVGSPITAENLNKAISKEMPIIMVIAVVIVLLILTLTSRSWLEPLIFMAVVAMAILMNMGTNVIFDSISYITNAVAAILQLALAMDYSIILLNNFAAEKAEGRRGKDAAIQALAKSFAPIASSALTTIVGLLALVFMSFRIGFDIGIVLSKGILFSMLCVFAVMPALILLLEKPIEKLSHKPVKLFGDKLAKCSLRAKKILPVIFVLLVAVAAVTSFVKTTYTYTGSLRSDDEAYIADKFGESSQVVLLYDSELDDDTERQMDARIAAMQGVKSVLSWGGIRLTPDLIKSAVEGADDGTVDMIMKFLPKDIVYASQLYDEVCATEDFVGDRFDDKMTEEDIVELTNIDPTMAKLAIALFGDEKTNTITLSQLIDGVNSSALGEAVLKTLSEQQRAMLTLAEEVRNRSTEYSQRIKSALEGARPMLVGNDHKRMLVTLSLPIENELTYALLDDIKLAANDYAPENYLAGESVINYDIATSFKTDNIIINVFTIIAILLIIGLTFMSVSVPVLLVSIIQGAIWISMSISAIMGSSVFFISYIICICIQMGATIDYGILITDFYLRARRNMQRDEAAIYALNEAMPTVFTSGLILIVASFLIGVFSSIMPISSIGLLLSRGALVSVLTVIFILPALLVILDKPLLKLTKRYRKVKQGKNEYASVECDNAEREPKTQAEREENQEITNEGNETKAEAREKIEKRKD